MANYNARPGATPQSRHVFSIPVYRTPEPEEFEDFSKDPMGKKVSDPSARALMNFYRSLHWPDSEEEVDKY